MKKKIILGAGQCGMKLAHDYYHSFADSSDKFVALSTSTEDSVSVPKKNLVQVAVEGSGKKFSNGNAIWFENQKLIENVFDEVYDSDVIYFTSAGGGSGSSSISHVSEILLNRGNRIFLIMVMPFGYENLPFKPNTLSSISSLQSNGLIDRISILLFDNEKLSKQYFDVEKIDYETSLNTTNLEKINEHIVNSTSLILNLINTYHDPSKFSPFTIDEIEHESVIFSKGFIGIDTRIYTEESAQVKFNYGKLSDAKNVIIAKSISLSESDYIIKQNAGNFLDKVKKISKRAKNARVMYGIVRSDRVENGTYIIIANNLNITKYIEKTKNKIGINVEEFLKKDHRDKLLTKSESKLFDI